MAETTKLQQTPLSVLDLAHMHQGGTAAEAFTRTLDLAQHVERWGYKRFWLAEHHNIAGVACSATSVLIGHVAAGTAKIRVGSGGIMLPNHAPLVIAEQFGTLEALYPGRIDLGLGRAPGGDFAVARALRRGLNSTGDDYPDLLAELRSYLTKPAPGQTVRAFPGANTNIPIWLLGSSDFSARLAGELGLPFAFAAHFQPQGMLEAFALYRNSFRPSTQLAKPYAMAGLPVLVAETDAKAKYLATTAQQIFLNMIRNRPVGLMPPVEHLDWNAFEEAAVHSRFQAAIIGSPKTVEKELGDFLEETQVDELMIVANTYEHAKRLRSYELLAELAGIANQVGAAEEVHS